jgi:hypothetical protein
VKLNVIKNILFNYRHHATRFLSNIVVSLISAFLTILFLMVLDFFISPRFIPYFDGVWEERVNPYISHEDGWYELKKTFHGKGHWGDNIYDVYTNKIGFRSDYIYQTTNKSEYIFLGDSFTFGVNGPYEDTFVGIFSTSLKNKSILNAGVPSYSPTVYLHQYKKALENDVLTDKHTVIVALDISDIQDEAACWEDGIEHPIKASGPCKPEKSEEKKITGWDAIKNRLRFTRSIIKFIDMKFRPNRYGIPIKDELFDQARSGFTWSKWDDLDKSYFPRGYLPKGINGGLSRVESKVASIVSLAQAHNSDVYIVIYPWPAQIKYPQTFNYENWVDLLCKKTKCAGVINTFSDFKVSSSEDWYGKYYLRGDIHFNLKGNQIIADKLISQFSRDK